MEIKALQLRNFRSFEEFELELCGGFNLVIGDNARGKTTILDGLSIGIGSLLLGFPSPAASKTIKQRDVRQLFFEHGQRITAESQFPCQVQCRGIAFGEPGTWLRELRDPHGRTTRGDAAWIADLGKQIHFRVQSGDDEAVLPALAHYGTERLWRQLSDNARDVETLSPDSRFAGYKDCLNPASNEQKLFEWFKTAELTALQRNERLDVLEACRHAILTCIPDATYVYYDVSLDSLILTVNGETRPFQFLSDGYRNMLALVADLAVKCSTLNPQLGTQATQCEGIALIDEIDLHLHPRWQRTVIGDLVKAFPNIQFVATTHSPFIIQSLPQNHEVKLINLDGEYLDDIPGRSVEDIAEFVQGVEMPQRSQRHVEMMKTAEEYFKMLEDDMAVEDETLQAKREKLQQAIQDHADNPAYQALIRMKEIVSEQQDENGKRFRGRGRKTVDPDDRENEAGGNS